MEKQQENESTQRWTTKRKSALVLTILRGETSTQEAARKHGLTVAEIEEWKNRFLPWGLKMHCGAVPKTMKHSGRNRLRNLSAK